MPDTSERMFEPRRARCDFTMSDLSVWYYLTSRFGGNCISRFWRCRRQGFDFALDGEFTGFHFPLRGRDAGGSDYGHDRYEGR